MNFRYLKYVFSLIALSVPLAAMVPEAEAGDYEAPVNTAYDWQGLYAGVGFGAGGTAIDFNSIGSKGSTELDAAKYNLSGIVGYNFTSGPFVLGVEGDFGRMGFKQTKTVPTLGNISAESNWEASMGLRAGYAFDSFLLYGKAGIAFSDLKLSSSLGGSSDKWRKGLMLGVGAEYAMTENWLVRGELTAYTFKGDQVIGGAKQKFDLGEGVARLGVTYKF